MSPGESVRQRVPGTLELVSEDAAAPFWAAAFSDLAVGLVKQATARRNTAAI